MKTSVAAALAGLAMASTPTLGADLFGTAPPPMSYSASQSPLAEVGSNWYLRGDVGLDFDKAPTFSMADISRPNGGAGLLPFSSGLGSSKWHDDYSGDIGVGYRFNNWLRFEGTYEYRTAASGSNRNSALCPTSLVAVPTGGPYSGYLYDLTGTSTTVCTGALSLTRRDSTALAAAYLGLGNYWGVTPYVGGGLGFNADIMTGNVAYTRNDTGTAYSANLTPGSTTVPQTWRTTTGGTTAQPNIGFTTQNWDHSIKQTHYSMAWALMAGLGFQLSPSVTLDVGYRYLNAGTNTLAVTPQTGASVKIPNVSQDIRVGIRLMAN